MRVGVDIGGTFTDIVLNVDGELHVHKLLSTPQNPAEAMLAGLETITGDLTKLTHVAHGSTVATNAILERNGAKIAFITTQGFRDMLHIGRQNRPVLYALHPTLPEPIIPRNLCYEVPERLDYNGETLLPLDIGAVDKVLDQIAEHADIAAIAVCLLYSFINAEHEDAIYQRIIERGLLEAWQIALSGDVLPEFREYERGSTTALEAYVRPKMVRYIDDLVSKLPEETIVRIMKSDGGVMQASRVRQQAINTALSGPAAGVIGAFYLSKLAGFDHIITLDMGGTSTDVALCPGETQLSSTSEIDGLPLRARFLDIETIGAGGGSIAYQDAGGALRVGPQSAGAQPGPIVYGQGGEKITVSDANALLGRLDPEHFLGGQMSLDLNAARTAFAEFSSQLGFESIRTARGIIDVANANIDRALRRVSVARGYDPREFTMVAFGGAGPLHACEVAERLDISRVLIPRYPGVLCALGLLVADVKVAYSYPILVRANRDLIARLRAMQSELIARGRDDLLAEGIAEDNMVFESLLDMRYEGQAHELTIPFSADVTEGFHEAHRTTYGHALRNRRIEIVNMRVQATGIIEKPTLEPEAATEPDPASAQLGIKESPLGGFMTLYDRDKLQHGMQFKGEALVFQLDSTVYIPKGWNVRVDGYRNLILERH